MRKALTFDCCRRDRSIARVPAWKPGTPDSILVPFKWSVTKKDTKLFTWRPVAESGVAAERDSEAFYRIPTKMVSPIIYFGLQVQMTDK